MEKKEFQRKYSLLRKEMDKIGIICTGSVISVFNKCGKKNCRCQKYKNARHGPYNIWTRKVKTKTITRTLNDEQAQFCQNCIQNLRELEFILEKMKELSAQYIENYKP